MIHDDRAQGHGQHSFRADEPGRDPGPVRSIRGRAIEVSVEHRYWSRRNVAHTSGRTPMSWFTTTETGDEQETHYPVGKRGTIDRFAASSGPGLLLLHGRQHIHPRLARAIANPGAAGRA